VYYSYPARLISEAFTRACNIACEPTFESVGIYFWAIRRSFYGICYTNYKKLYSVLFNDLHRHYTLRSGKKILSKFIALCGSGKKLQINTVYITDCNTTCEIEHFSNINASVNKNIPLRMDTSFPVGNNLWQFVTTQGIDKVNSLLLKHQRKSVA